MARLDFFTGEGAVNSPAHIRPANNGSFPLIDAHDVQVGSNPTDANDRLDATLEDIDAAINTINSELGSGSSDSNATIKKRLAAAETNIGNKVNTSDIQTTVRAAASASDSKIPSEKAVRSAIDNATVSTTDTPTSGSAAAFSAGGAYTELAKKVNTNDIQGTVNTSSNPPSSNAVKTYVDAADDLKVNTSDIQTTVRAAASASDSKIPSEKAVRSAIDNATVSTTATPASGSAAAFSAGGAYTELAKKVNVNDVQSSVNTSANPVSSNAVKTYVDAADATKVNTSDIQTTVRDASSASDSKIPSEKAVRSAIDSKTITIDSTVTEGSTNAVSGGAVHTQLATKQDTLTFDTTPTASSSNPVTSGGVKAALDNKQNTLTYETTPIVGSVNPVTSTGIRNAIDAAAASNLGQMQAAYAEFVADADAVLDRASSLSNGMVACSNIAAETTVGDTRILLYTGTTNANYTNGHWYYNSAPSNAAPLWTDGGAVGSAPTIDNTLAIDGAAANSKSVGDAIENIVTISNTQPGSNSGNKVWIKETTSEEVQVPTYAEHIAKANKADIATNNESDNGSGTITASKAYAIGDHFYINNTNTSSENYGVSVLYKATAAIASGDAIVVGTNCEASKVADEITSLSNDIDTVKADLDTLSNATLGEIKTTIELTANARTGTPTSRNVLNFNQESNKSGYQTAIIDCQSGDVFDVYTNTQSTSYNSWAFYRLNDEETGYKKTSGDTGTDTVTRITAGTNDVKLVINNNTTYIASPKVKKVTINSVSLKNRIDSIDTIIAKNLNHIAFLRRGLNYNTTQKIISIPTQQVLYDGKRESFSETKTVDTSSITNYFALVYNKDTQTFSALTNDFTLTNSQYIVGAFDARVPERGFVFGGYTINGFVRKYGTEEISTCGLENVSSDWWVYPIAVKYTGIRNKTYAGFISNTGIGGIIAYNNVTHFVERHNLFISNEVDEHNVPSVSVLSNGKIMAIFTRHARTPYHVICISKGKESISDFDKYAIKTEHDAVTYSQVIDMGGILYLFYRAHDYVEGTTTTAEYHWCYRTSTDGITWSNEVTWLAGGSVQYYILARKYDATHIKIFMHSNSTLSETDIRLGFFDIENDKVLDADMETEIADLGLLSEPISYTEFSIILAKTDTYKNRLLSVAEGTDLSFTCGRIASANNYTVNFYKYTNGTWTEYTIPDVGVSFGHDTNSTYINHAEIVNIDNGSYTVVYSANTGLGWELRKVAIENTVDTPSVLVSSNNKIIRPFKIVNDNSVIFTNGEWVDYKNYNQDFVVKTYAN